MPAPGRTGSRPAAFSASMRWIVRLEHHPKLLVVARGFRAQRVAESSTNIAQLDHATRFRNAIDMYVKYRKENANLDRRPVQELAILQLFDIIHGTVRRGYDQARRFGDLAHRIAKERNDKNAQPRGEYG